MSEYSLHPERRRGQTRDNRYSVVAPGRAEPLGYVLRDHQSPRSSWGFARLDACRDMRHQQGRGYDTPHDAARAMLDVAERYPGPRLAGRQESP